MENTGLNIVSSPPPNRSRQIVFWLIATVIFGFVGYYLGARQRATEPPKQIPDSKPATPSPQPEPQKAASLPDAPIQPTAVAPPEEVTDQLLVWLPLKTDFADRSPRKMHTSTVGHTRIENGAAVFDGDSDWIVLPHIDFSQRAFSFSVWMRMTEQRTGEGLLEQQDEFSDNRLLHIGFRDRSVAYFGFYNNDLPSQDRITVQDGWQHLAFVFTGNRQQIWIQGVLTADRDASPYMGQHGETVIGKGPSFSNVDMGDFKGLMRDVRLYSRALSEREIRILAGLAPDIATKPKARESDF